MLKGTFVYIYLIEVVNHEADMWVGHLLTLSLSVHLAARRRRVHLRNRILRYDIRPANGSIILHKSGSEISLYNNKMFP